MAHCWKDGCKAHYLVQKALRNGALTRPDTCELCRAKPEAITYHWCGGLLTRATIEAHHWRGYDYPLDVWFICRDCNRKLKGEKYHNGATTKEQARAFVIAQKAAVKPASPPYLSPLSCHCSGDGEAVPVAHNQWLLLSHTQGNGKG